MTAFAFLSLKVMAQPIPEMLYYTFNGSGTSVPNYASNPPAGTATATIMGGVTQGSTGLCGGALVGSGVASSTDYLNTGFVTAMPTSWTISFFTQDFTSSSTLFYIFGDVTAGSFRCFTNGVAGANNWILRGPGINDITIAGGATVAPHVCTYVYDGAVSTVYAYLDGALVNTVVQVAPQPIIGTGPFKVMGYSSNVGAPIGGKIDEFRMYDRALSAAEVLELNTGVTENNISVSSCDSYFWPESGNTYSTSGMYSTILQNPVGCDSMIVLDLTINTASSAPVEIVSSCDSYVWSGNTYIASGMYYDTLVAATGCDSLLTLDLTIDQSPSDIVTVSSCDSYTWSADGNTYSSSGTYYYTSVGSAAPCDSMYTLELTIEQSTSSTITQTALDSYTAPSGAIYTTSGTYTDVILNAAGCDSTITIILTVEYTGITELVNGTLILYPNPTQSTIRVLGAENLLEIKEVSIASVAGKRVMNVSNIQDEIKIAELENGVYFLNIEHGSGIVTIQFVKQ